MTTTIPRPILRAAPSENWDEDFEFQANAETDGDVETAAHQSRLASSTSEASRHKLQEWVEPGPSTPNKRRMQQFQAENWDDDFEDSNDSPARLPGSHSQTKYNQGSVASRKRRADLPLENWDEDSGAGKSDSPVGKRSNLRHNDTNYISSDSDSDPAELGFADKEEDKTITARSRRLQSSPPPPVPPLPPFFSQNLADPSPFPRSPTASVFSVPTSRDRDSLSIAYGSTAHLALHPTHSGSSAALGVGSSARGFAGLPPSPPIHRERRRLRKKSRPGAMDPNLIELIDLDPDQDLVPPVPIPRTPEPNEVCMTPPSTPPQVPTEPSSPQQPKSPVAILSRIGSVSKRWGRRKSRASVGPEEISMSERERSRDVVDNDATPVGPSHSHSSKNWFFRGAVGTSAAGERDEDGRMTGGGRESVVDLDSPTKAVRRKSSSGAPSKLRGRPPTATQQSPPSSPRKPVFSRHVSYAGITFTKSHSRSGSASAEDLSLGYRSSREAEVDRLEKDKMTEKEREGTRFRNGVRKISLIGGGGTRHRRTQSSSLGGHEHEHDLEALELPPSLPPLPSSSPLASYADLSVNMDTSPTPDHKPSTSELLPPIELQPPSPPRVRKKISISRVRASQSVPITSTGVDSLLPPINSHSPSKSSFATPTKSPVSPHSASLGRSSQSPVRILIPATGPVANGGSVVPRRNSLGDLKIPARISQAQVGLRRDLGLVRDFAANVEKLKELQMTYMALVHEAQQILDAHPSSTRPVSPSFFNLPRARGRARSNTNPVPPEDPHKQFAEDYYALESKYKVTWECAQLLIELGGGAPVETSPSTNMSAPLMQTSQSASVAEGRMGRERAITLSGDESKPVPASLPSPPIASPPHLAWRASTGRHDLSQRQLLLLKEMLHNNNSDSSSSSFLANHIPELQIPEETVINRVWRWGDAMSSTITLPSEESSAVHSSPRKKRRTSKLGMHGLRDMLRSLKKNSMEQSKVNPVPTSSASGTESSLEVNRQQRSLRSLVPTQRRRAKTSIGPESVKSTREHPNSPYGTENSLNHKPSPRRPSLASIFRLGQKHKAATPADPSQENVGASGNNDRSRGTEEDEDWDEIDSYSDLDLAAKVFGMSSDGMATVKGKRKQQSPYNMQYEDCNQPALPKKTPNPSQSSIFGEAVQLRPNRLSNVEENTEGDQRQSRADVKSKRRSSVIPSLSPKRPPSRGSRRGKSGSVRSAPPRSALGPEVEISSDPKLAMTPQNIQPLLENAREVETRVNDCIAELKLLLAAKG